MLRRFSHVSARVIADRIRQNEHAQDKACASVARSVPAVERYFAWLDSPALEEPQFLQIQSRYVPGRALPIPVDWWPKGEIQERIAFYSRPNYMNPYHTKAGTVNTVELLWQARGNLERQHLVYILASLRDLEKDLPESWRGDPFRLLQDVWRVVKEQLTEDGVLASRE
jgi:hypothetical protein